MTTETQTIDLSVPLKHLTPDRAREILYRCDHLAEPRMTALLLFSLGQASTECLHRIGEYGSTEAIDRKLTRGLLEMLALLEGFVEEE